MPARAGVTRTDLAVAAAFVLAALAETVVVHRHPWGLLVFTGTAAPLLAVLALRRTRPVVPLVVVAAVAAVGTTAQALWWPRASDSGGVWLFALLFCAYSLGAHARGRRLVLGALLPLGVALAVDVPSLGGWALVNGVAFVTLFVGVLPTLVGRAVLARRERLARLRIQRDQVAAEQQSLREAAVLAERVRTAEHLQPTLLQGLRTLAEQADGGAEAGEVEQAARRLLGRTRQEVVALAAPVDVPDVGPAPPVEHLAPLRAQAQRWAVLAAGAIGAGLVVEAAGTHTLATSTGMGVVAGLAVAAPLGLVWWRPVPAVLLAWAGLTAFSRLVAPVDGTLSGTALALVSAFAVAALSSRRAALLGLAVCWCGQLVGVGANDPIGEAVILLVCWVGGLAVNEASRLVELGRATNALLAGQDDVARQRAVVEERLRLARELHDQIGHSLTVVAIQAGAARRLAATDPQRASGVMATIASVARDGLTALTGEPDGDLPALLDRTRAAGLEVRAERSELAATELLDARTRALTYRVVQEGLTNVLRHAPGARADVRLRDDGGTLTIEVRNSAPARRAALPAGGRGLVGLRERLAACCGEIRWGQCADGGFLLQAALPVAGGSGADA